MRDIETNFTARLLLPPRWFEDQRHLAALVNRIMA
jgi:hypothetical protein